VHCSRCKKELDPELAAKFRIIDEMFLNPGDPDYWLSIDERWHECYECHARLSRRIRGLFVNLFDPIWWEYHSPLRHFFYWLHS
jgi:hypothetical protein